MAFGRLDEQVGNVVLVCKGSRHMQAHTLVILLVPTAIDGLACLLQMQHDLCGQQAIARQLVLAQSNVDDLGAGTHHVDAFHPRHLEQFAAYQLGIALHLGVGEAWVAH